MNSSPQIVTWSLHLNPCLRLGVARTVARIRGDSPDEVVRMDE